MMFNLAICAGPQAVRNVWMTKPRLGHRQTIKAGRGFLAAKPPPTTSRWLTRN